MSDSNSSPTSYAYEGPDNAKSTDGYIKRRKKVLGLPGPNDNNSSGSSSGGIGGSMSPGSSPVDDNLKKNIGF